MFVKDHLGKNTQIGCVKNSMLLQIFPARIKFFLKKGLPPVQGFNDEKCWPFYRN
jgi:hypothetical protein